LPDTSRDEQLVARAERLRSFLARDPDNKALQLDAATAALDAGLSNAAVAVVDDAEVRGTVEPNLRNLRALAQLREGRAQAAIDDLLHVREQNEDTPQLRFNLAWAYALTEAWDQAADLLDEDAVAASPRGPSLKIQVLHHLDRYEDALQVGAELALRFPNNEALMGALATLSMDAEREDLARGYAEKAGDSSEGLAARGLFALEADEPINAALFFDRALEAQPANPRAWVGKGLALLAEAEPALAADALDRGAEIFGNHPGSWIAAGWAHFIAGDVARARARFERVTAIDPTFSEGHGGLAVIALLSGDADTAKRSSEIALKLDRTSLGGALASSLLLQSTGQPEAANRIREIALNSPIGPGGKTLAQALAASARGFVKS